MHEFPNDITPLTPPPEFFTSIASLELEFDSGDLERLGMFLALLLETNKQFNLTRITNPDEASSSSISFSPTISIDIFS